MKYTIVYSSKSGNTARLAQEIKQYLGEENCLFFGPISDHVPASDLLFAGFWTDKGTCSQDMAAFLKSRKNESVFLFGTAGFGGSEEYFSQILMRVLDHIGNHCSVAGTYMCQGRMPLAVRNRYEAMAAQNPEQAKKLLENFDRAMTHPDEDDFQQLREILKNIN